ncbi:unnamed protein product, partial [Lepidochelys olivacea]
TCDLEKSADEKPSEIIRNKRKKLVEILQKDLELILDELLSQSIVTEEEYNTLDKTEEDPKKKIRKLLILIQKKGESVCQQFLGCLEIVFPGIDQDLYLSSGYPQSKRTPHLISLTMEAENDLIFLFNDREEKVDILQAPELIETTPQLPKVAPIAVSCEKAWFVSGMMTPDSPKKRAHCIMEDMDLSSERRKAFREVLSKLKLQKYESRKLRMNVILEISSGSLKDWIPQKLRDLPWHFLRKVMALNRTARSTSLRCGALHDQGTRVDEEEQ